MPEPVNWRWQERERVASWPEFRPNALVHALVAGDVDFVVVGGYAAIAQGTTRVTHDLDVCFAGDRANLERLGRVLVDLDARLRGVDEDLPFVPDAATLARIRVLTLATNEGPLDVMVQPDGSPRYAQLRDRADRLEVGGAVVLVASLEDLIAMKRASARGKDLHDLAELEEIARLRGEA